MKSNLILILILITYFLIHYNKHQDVLFVLDRHRQIGHSYLMHAHHLEDPKILNRSDCQLDRPLFERLIMEKR